MRERSCISHKLVAAVCCGPTAKLKAEMLALLRADNLTPLYNDVYSPMLIAQLDTEFPISQTWYLHHSHATLSCYQLERWCSLVMACIS